MSGRIDAPVSFEEYAQSRPWPELHLGFTGTETSMTQQQGSRVIAWVTSYSHYNDVVGHHGDCVGSDEAFHDLCIGMHIRVRIHPPLNPKKRAFCQGAELVYPAKPYLKRDEDIARTTRILLATPREMAEVLRSGTWATIRAARRLGRDVVIFLPDGSVTS
jgi:hypothetical protein